MLGAKKYEKEPIVRAEMGAARNDPRMGIVSEPEVGCNQYTRGRTKVKFLNGFLPKDFV